MDQHWPRQRLVAKANWGDFSFGWDKQTIVLRMTHYNIGRVCDGGDNRRRVVVS